MNHIISVLLKRMKNLYAVSCSQIQRETLANAKTPLLPLKKSWRLASFKVHFSIYFLHLNFISDLRFLNSNAIHRFYNTRYITATMRPDAALFSPGNGTITLFDPRTTIDSHALAIVAASETPSTLSDTMSKNVR